MPKPSPSSLHKIDEIDRAVGIDTDHDKVHQGERFTAFTKTTLAGDGILNILLITPVAIQSHLLIHVSGMLGGVVDVFKGTTVSDNGTAMPKFNKNDNYASETGDSLLYTGPTIDGDGTQFTALNFAAGKSAGGDVSFGSERVLGPDEKYLFRITSDDNNNRIVADFDWYEVAVG